MPTEPTGGTAAPPPLSPSLPPGAADVPLPLANTLESANALAAPTASRFRWVVLTLVFFAITINYVDRMVIGLLAPDYLKQPNGPITEEQFGYIGTAFGLSYAIGQLLSGRWLDWIGTRKGYAIALFSWSVASMMHALARTSLGFGFMRALLGVTESPAYPAANKTLAEWFPKKERALAMGFANAGANVGAVLAPLLVPMIAAAYGWRMAFIATGAVGLIWLFFWIPMYRRPHEHPRVSPEELAYINSDPPEPAGKVRWLKLLTFPQAWAFVAGKFLTDPVWSFYLFWLPSFLKKTHGLTGTQVMIPMIVIYLLADVGSIGGGWLSSSLIKRGWSVNAARKFTMGLCALLIVPAVFASIAPGVWLTVAIAGTALAAHQGFSANLYTLVSDMFPRRAVGSVSGLGGFFGYIGFAIFSAITGIILQRTNQNYLPVMIICGTAYLLAFTLIHVLAPRLEPVRLEDDNAVPGFEVTPPRA